jgi:hypothetical protein
MCFMGYLKPMKKQPFVFIFQSDTYKYYKSVNLAQYGLYTNGKRFPTVTECYMYSPKTKLRQGMTLFSIDMNIITDRD